MARGIRAIVLRVKALTYDAETRKERL